MSDIDTLIQQVGDLQADLARVQQEKDSLVDDNRTLRYRLEELQTRYDRSQAVVSTVTRRQGAFAHRNKRLQQFLDSPPKALAQMSRGELLAFVQAFLSKITTPIPEDPNEDTV